MVRTTPIRILENCDNDIKGLMKQDEQAERMDKPSYTSFLIWKGIEKRKLELSDVKGSVFK